MYPVLSYLKNKIFPEYYYNKDNKRFYKMICWWGYDKYSSTIAHMYDLNGKSRVSIPDCYWEGMVRVRNMKIARILYETK